MAKLRRCSIHDEKKKRVTAVRDSLNCNTRLRSIKEHCASIPSTQYNFRRIEQVGQSVLRKQPPPPLSRYLFDGDSSSEENFDAFKSAQSSAHNCEICVVGHTLRCLGDELDLDKQFQRMLKQVVKKNTSIYLVKEVAAEVFADGTFNWGRIITFLYFVYRILSENVKNSKVASVLITLAKLPFVITYTILAFLTRFTFHVIDNAYNDEQSLTLLSLTVSVLIALIIVANLSNEHT